MSLDCYIKTKTILNDKTLETFVAQVYTDNNIQNCENKENMVLLNIYWYKYLTDFGTELGFNIWDWSAVVVSLCSVLIAIVSLCVAVKTLKSQKKTEKNTAPLIDVKIQLFLLNNSLRELYESFISITALFSALELTKYRVSPSKQFWDLVYIDTNNFHAELFYGDENRFRKMYYLMSYIKKFNNDVSDLRDRIANKNVDWNLKKEIILHICEDIGDLLQLWVKVYLVSFDLSKYEMLASIEQNFFNCRHCKFNTIYNDDKELIKYYIQNSPFENQVDEILETFEKKIYYLISIYSLDYKQKDFKSNVWHYVDLLMLNVLYEHKPFAAHVINASSNTTKYKFNTSDPQKNTSNNNWCETPFSQNIRKTYSWIFYLVNNT